MLAKAHPWLAKIWRLSLLVAAVWLIRQQSAPTDVAPLELDRVKDYFPTAAAISAPDAAGIQTLTDKNSLRIGYVTQTSPASNRIIGYSGPTNSLLALDPNGRVIGLRVLHSEDTPEHLAEVVAHRPFFHQFKEIKLGAVDPAFTPDTVTGATLTSTAIAEGVLARLGGSGASLRFPDPITLAEVQELLPEAVTLKEERVLDASGKVIARALRTSPTSDAVTGYKGPSDTLMLLSADGKNLLRVKLRKSYDTEAYVGCITGDSYFVNQLAMPMEKLAALDYEQAGIEGVSGATQTSYAMAEGLKQRAQTWLAAQQHPLTALMEKVRWRWQDTGHVMVLVAAFVMAFTRLRGIPWVRHLHHALLVVYGGFMVGELLSQALFAGWARSGTPWRSAPGLLLLAVVALLAPVFTRRQIYCHHICPHGALQQLLARRLPWQWKPGPRVLKILHALPQVLLAFVLFAAITGLAINLNVIEPFDAYVWKVAGLAAIIIFIVGILASLFLPLAYCHHGCPTGALFGYLRSSGASDRIGKRDLIAAALLIGFGVLAHFRDHPAMEVSQHLEGEAMGSTWSVTVAHARATDLQPLVARRLEALEDIFSHYRPQSALSRFNSSRSTDWHSVPPELGEVVALAKQVHAETSGSLEPTLAPLVNLWGFGPEKAKRAEPSAHELTQALKSVGLHHVQVQISPPALKKTDPDVTLNLSALVEGYAAGEIDDLLVSHGSTDHLVNIGGEVKARGLTAEGKAWAIGIQHPAAEGACGTIHLQDEAIATSGTYRQRSADRRANHIIDPRTGQPVKHATESVTVVHAEPALADAYATALLVLGSDEGQRMAQRLGLRAVFIDRTSAKE
jgi:NosR/NirI family transcriptional regulator, nitrous oxide reductase regulator